MCLRGSEAPVLKECTLNLILELFQFNPRKLYWDTSACWLLGPFCLFSASTTGFMLSTYLQDPRVKDFLPPPTLHNETGFISFETVSEI